MLKVYVSWKFSAFIAAVGLVMAIVCIIALNGAGPDLPYLARILLWVLLPAMFYGFIIGVRQLLNPPLMFLADRRGLTIHYEARRNRYTATGVFLPWESVADLALEKIRTGGEGGRSWIVVCTLNAPAPFPVRAHSVAWSNSWSDLTLSLDAFTGTLTKHELLDRLIPLWKSASASAARSNGGR